MTPTESSHAPALLKPKCSSRLGTHSQRRSNHRRAAPSYWVYMGAAVALPQPLWERLGRHKSRPMLTQWGDATARGDSTTQRFSVSAPRYLPHPWPDPRPPNDAASRTTTTRAASSVNQAQCHPTQLPATQRGFLRNNKKISTGIEYPGRFSTAARFI